MPPVSENGTDPKVAVSNFFLCRNVLISAGLRLPAFSASPIIIVASYALLAVIEADTANLFKNSFLNCCDGCDGCAGTK